MKGSSLSIFKGRNSVKDFLNPDRNPLIPLVEIPEHCNLFKKDGVVIYAKLMNMLPLGNVKSLPALNMLTVAEKNGQLRSTQALIENSSGNTVFSLATLGRIFGVSRTRAIVSHEVSWGKLQLLRLFGTEVFVNEESICPDPNDITSGIYKAKILGKQKGWFNPGQYDNEANPEAHYRWTAPQIWKQTEGKISVFCAGVGTTGTILGVGSYLKKKSKKITVIGVARLPNNPVPGVRTETLLQEIAFDWKKTTDDIQHAGTRESFEESMKLCRAGLMVGPSAGFALKGLLNFLRERKASGRLDSLRNRDGKVVAVFICPDSPLPYLNEYFEYLDESHFPRIENEHLLINKPDRKEKQIPLQKNLEITSQEAYSRIVAKEDFLLIDVRTSEEYFHVHLETSENIEHTEILRNISKFSKKWKQKKIILVCRSGRRSLLVAESLKRNGVDAVSIEGGMVEWSRLDLPRKKPLICR